MTLSGRPRPQAEIRIRQARHGAWVVEIHYRGSSIYETVDMRVHQGEALALAEFVRLLRADDELMALDREGDAIAAEDAWTRRWATAEDAEDET